MHAIIAIATLLIGIAILLAGNGLLGTLLGVRGELEGFSSATLGVIMGGYFGGFVIGTFLIPGIIRRIGHIRMFAALAAVASMVALLHGMLVNPAAWFVLRIVAGICIVGLYIVIESWLNEQTPNEQRGHVFSAYMTTTLIGLGIGQVLLMAGEIESLHLFALAALLLSAGLVPVALTRVREPAIVEAHRLGLRKLYAISPLGLVGCVFSGLGSGAFWGLGPVFASAIGLGAGGVAAFMGLTILGGIVMMWPVGWLSDRFDRRVVLLWICLLTSVAATGIYVLTEAAPTWVVFGGFAYGTFAFSIYALSAAHTNDHVEPEQMLEITSSLQLLWGSGAIVGPIAAGLIMQWTDPRSLLPFMAFAALLPALFARYRMSVAPPVPSKDQGDFVPQFATSPAALEMHPELEDIDAHLDPK
jgi:MFS family permease